jgi:DNA-binding transcriptional LysR family regulator
VGRPLGKTRLDPEAMLVFAALARAGGVRAAAKALDMPRSTVSRRLGELEEQSGAPLVMRTARRFTLTEVGTALAARCAELEDVLTRSEEAVRSASREPSGVLRVAAAPVLGEEVLPLILASLVERHPKLSVHVGLSVDYVDLRRGGVDVALRAWSIEDASDLFAVRLGTSTTGCWVSPAYARAHGTPKTPADLLDHDCILVGSAPRVTWSFEGAGRASAVVVRGRVRVDSFRLARDLAALGGGVLRAARILAEPRVLSGDLVPVLQRYWPSTPIHAVHAGPNPPTPKVRAFIELAREHVAKALPPNARERSREG